MPHPTPTPASLTERVVTRIQVATAIAARGGVALAEVHTLPDPAAALPISRGRAGADQFSFAVPHDDPTYPFLRWRRVVWLDVATGTGGITSEEWRLNGEARSHDQGTGIVASVTALPILPFDAIDAGPCADYSESVLTFTGAMIDATIAEFAAQIAHPTLDAAGRQHVRITVDPAYADVRYDFEWNNEDVVTVLRRALSPEQAGPRALELDYRPVVVPGSLPTGYVIACVTRRGAEFPPLLVAPDRNLRRLARSYDGNNLATRYIVRAAEGTGVDQNVWRVVAESARDPLGVTLTFADPEGGTNLVTRTGQHVNGFLRRLRTGRSFAIVAVTPAAPGAMTSAVRLEPAPAAIAPGELFEVIAAPGDPAVGVPTRRRVIPLTAGTTSGNPTTFGTLRGFEFQFDAIDATARQATFAAAPELIGRNGFGPGDAGRLRLNKGFTTPDALDDLRLEVWRPIVGPVEYVYRADFSDPEHDNESTALVEGTAGYTHRLLRSYEVVDDFDSEGNPIAWRPETAGVPLPSGIAVGDAVVFLAAFDADLHLGVVTRIAADRLNFDAVPLYPTAPAVVSASNRAIRRVFGFRKQSAFPRVLAVDANDRVTLDTAAGLAAGDRFVVVLEPEPARYLAHVNDPVAESKYGTKLAPLSLDGILGVRDLTGNGQLQEWPAGQTLPTGYVVDPALLSADALANVQRLTSAGSTQDVLYRGARTLRLMSPASPTLVSAQILGLRVPIRYHPRVTDSVLSLRAMVRVVTFGRPEALASARVQFSVYDATRRSVLVGESLLGETELLDTEDLPPEVWTAVVLEGIPLDPGVDRARDLVLRVRLQISGRAGTFDYTPSPVALDFAGVSLVNRGAAPPALLRASGSNRAIAAALTALGDRSDPEGTAATYEIALADRSRLDPATYAGEVPVPGRHLTIQAAALGVNVSGVAISSVNVDARDPRTATITAAREPARQSDTTVDLGASL